MNIERKPVRASLLFWMIAGLCTFFFIEIGALWLWRRAASKSEARRQSQRAEFEQWDRRAPSLTARNEAAARQRLEAVRSSLAGIQRKWTERIVRADSSYLSAAPEFLVALAEMRERLSSAAEANGVRIAGEAASFGFGALAQQPPPPEARRALERQRHAVELLLAALFEARPRTLLVVQREPVLAGSTEVHRDPAARTAGRVPVPARTETMVMEAGRQWLATTEFHSTAFRFSFCGETETLRIFLNQIASREWPAVIREVEVAPATLAEIGSSAASGTGVASTSGGEFAGKLVSAQRETVGQSVRPVVQRQWSRFVVTLEWIEALAPANEVSA